MDISTPDWSKKEFLAYLLLYSANGDYVETEEEIALIKSKVGTKVFEQIHEEFDKDTDYQRIQKIMASCKAHNYSKEEINTILKDIETLFFADGRFVTLEKNLLLGIRHLLR